MKFILFFKKLNWWLTGAKNLIFGKKKKLLVVNELPNSGKILRFRKIILFL